MKLYSISLFSLLCISPYLNGMATMRSWYAASVQSCQSAYTALGAPVRYLKSCESSYNMPAGTLQAGVPTLSLASLAALVYASKQNQTVYDIMRHALIDPLLVAGVAGLWYRYRGSQLDAWGKMLREEDNKLSFISWHSTDRFQQHWATAHALRNAKDAVLTQLVNDCEIKGIRSAAALKSRIIDDKKIIRDALDTIAHYTDCHEYILRQQGALPIANRIIDIKQTRTPHENIMANCRKEGKHLQALTAQSYKDLYTLSCPAPISYAEHVCFAPSILKPWQWVMLPRKQEMRELYWDLTRLYARLLALEDVVGKNAQSLDTRLKAYRAKGNKGSVAVAVVNTRV